ncbi:MAG: hypothetical protein MUF24_04340 [Chitinophagaceae bacterium]|nr:hypothetical protein [Chitinophagaceae bacterium]
MAIFPSRVVVSAAGTTALLMPIQAAKAAFYFSISSVASCRLRRGSLSR